LNRLFLTDAGVPDAQIDWSDFCTYCHPELFWSHRYTHGERGAMLGAISL
ncbi:MAG: laccase domain-containing protein, partial [Clostridia bacterium]|nr:laccase domain-containing protein [Clostridia bacterium]